MEQAKMWWATNVDTKMVVSGLMTAVILGVGVYALQKSNVKALQAVAKVVK